MHDDKQGLVEVREGLVESQLGALEGQILGQHPTHVRADRKMRDRVDKRGGTEHDGHGDDPPRPAARKIRQSDEGPIIPAVNPLDAA